MPGLKPAAGRLLVGLLGLLLVMWGLGAFCAAVLQASDLEALRDVVARRSAGLTSVARVLTWAGSVAVIGPLTVLGGLALYRRGRRAEAGLLAVSVLGALVLYDVDKVLVGRPRPPVHHLEVVAHASFPSGHATTASAFYGAVLLLLLAARPRPAVRIGGVVVIVFVVLAVAASRLYLGVHYPTDVAAGLLAGGSWSAFAFGTLGLSRRPAVRAAQGSVGHPRARLGQS